MLFLVVQNAGEAMSPAQVEAQLARAQADIARERAQLSREREQMVRDIERAMRDVPRVRTEPGVVVPPFPLRGLSRRQEGMLFTGFLFAVMAGVAVMYPILRALARRLEGAPARAGLGDKGSAERLERIEQAVEAMAIEIERISEGQRFTTRLLADRIPAQLPVER